MLDKMNNEEIVQHIWVTVEQRTELEIQLAERIANLLDELADFDGDE